MSSNSHYLKQTINQFFEVKLNNLTFTILAGGKSKRFGTNKLFYTFEGKPLIQHSLDIAINFSEEIIIVGDHKFPKEYYNFTIVSDVEKNCGPLMGIYTALLKSTNDYIAFIPGDMPNLNKEMYFKLFEKRDANIPVIGESNFGLEPLLSIWPKVISDKIEIFLKDRNYSIKKFLEFCTYKSVDFRSYPVHVFKNINRMSDL